jgi:hypothetical protein
MLGDESRMYTTACLLLDEEVQGALLLCWLPFLLLFLL